MLSGLQLQYAPQPGSADDWTATSLINHTAPELRLAAVRLLSVLARQQQPTTAAAAAAPCSYQNRVDAAFLSLCSAVSNDTITMIRLEALAGLAELHHASHAVKQQALSKRAMLRVAGTAAAAAGSKQAGATPAADSGLLHSATGALVHGLEDDVAQVRIAAVGALLRLGSGDLRFSEEAALLLVDCVADELLPVRLAALQGLIAWAAAHKQRQQAAKQQQQQQQQQQDVMHMDGEEQQPADPERQSLHRAAGQAQHLPAQTVQQQQQQQQQDAMHMDGEEQQPADPERQPLHWEAGQAQHLPAQTVQQQQQQQDAMHMDGKEQQPADPERQSLHWDTEQPQQLPAQRVQQQQQQHDADVYEEEEGEVLEEGELPDIAPIQLHSHQPDNEQDKPSGSSTPAALAAAAAAVAAVLPSGAQAAKKPAKKKRKTDLPPWAMDAQAAALAALRDKHHQVRALALQLLQLLPPASFQAILSLLQGLISCCERFGVEHKAAALEVIRALVLQRTPLVAKSTQTLARLLAKAVGGGPPGAEGAAAQVAGAASAGAATQVQQPLLWGPVSAARPPPSTAAAAAAGQPGIALELLSALITAAAGLKPQLLPSLYAHLNKLGVRQAQPLQPLMAQLEGMQQQQRLPQE